MALKFDILVLLKFIPLEFETVDDINICPGHGQLKFIPLEFL